MHSINGCQSSAQNGGGGGSTSNASTSATIGSSGDSEIETLHPLTLNHSSSTTNTLDHYTNLKSSLNNNTTTTSSTNTTTLNSNKAHLFDVNRANTFTNGQRDILRLIGQHLRYLGLSKTTDTLIAESGCMLEHPIATSFCNLIMSGEWEKAERLLNDLKSLMDSNVDITKMRFLILEQKYMECLEDGKVLEALKCLRDELAPLKYNTDRLHELSSYLMCGGNEDLKKLSKWEGKTLASRQTLMDKLQTFLPPNVMLPPKRLESLISQAVELQCERCPFHNTNEKFSIDSWTLLKDHMCSKDDFPSVNIQILTDHCDEVWYCKFSNDGSKLATGSKDGILTIWDVNPQTLKLTLNKSYDDHQTGVAWISWSPDDRYVIVCGTEECNELWIWDIEQKVLKKRFNNNHDDSLTSASWLPDGQSFVAGGTKGQFYYCDIDGIVKDTWEGIRIKCLQCLPDGVVLAADSLKRIRSYNFKDITDSNLIQEDYQIMSFILNKQANLALIAVASQGLHLWDLKERVLVRRYQGALQNHYTSYCTFGGVDERYVAMGSEDNRVYIWHIKKEQAICVLEGHTRNVNCVSWNPTIHGLMATVSDDGTIRIWAPSRYQTTQDTATTSNQITSSINNNNINNNNNNNNNNDNNNNIQINNNTTESLSTINSNSSSNSNRSDRSTPV